ncbi:hypothetical protein OAB94_02450 [Flavobacteriaceae bacterium]|nr:hypothetical protein [Flavobacteriaceae bacterium]
MSIQKLTRVWQVNQYTTIASSSEIYDFIDRDNVQVKTFLVEDDLSDDQIPMNHENIQNQMGELKKRRTLVVILLLTLFFIAVVEGLHLANINATQNLWVIVLMYFVNKMSQTMVISVAMIHAFFHGLESGRWPWYLIISILWLITVSVATIPALTNFIGVVQDFPALMVFYGFAAGILLWMAFYFIEIDRPKTTMKRTIIRIAIFFAPVATAYMTSFFV